MSGQPYLDQDTIDQCRQSLRQGGELEFLAVQLQCDPSHLANLLRLPSIQSVHADQGCDLWRVDPDIL